MPGGRCPSSHKHCSLNEQLLVRTIHVVQVVVHVQAVVRVYVVVYVVTFQVYLGTCLLVAANCMCATTLIIY